MSIENTEQRAQRHPALDGLVHLTYTEPIFEPWLKDPRRVEAEFEEIQTSSIRAIEASIRSKEVQLQREEAFKREFQEWIDKGSAFREINGIQWHEHLPTNRIMTSRLVEIAFIYDLSSIEEFKTLSDEDIYVVTRGRVTIGAIRDRYPYQVDQ